MKIRPLFIMCMLSMQVIMYASEQILTLAQQRQDIIDFAMAPENYVDLKQDLAFLESQNLLEPDSFRNLLEQNVTQSQDADFYQVIEKAEDLIAEKMKDPFIWTVQRALEEDKPLDSYINYVTTSFGAIQIPLFTYVMQRKNRDMTLQNLVYSWLLEWSNTKNNIGFTPLFIAAWNGHTSIVRLLLAVHANVDSSTMDNGKTPLIVAAWNGHAEIVQLLIAAHANVNSQITDNGATPLYMAAWSGHTEIARLLITAGANVDIQTKFNGATPLYMAAQQGHAEVAQMLLAVGANVMIQDNNGRIAENVAATGKIRAMIRRRAVQPNNNQSQAGYCTVS